MEVLNAMRCARSWFPVWAVCSVLLPCTFLLPGQGSAASAPVEASKEYQVKAAFLFNFIQFVKWPETAFRDADAPICIGVLGEDPFGAALDETVRGERIGGRDLVVRRSQAIGDLRDCQLLFVGKSEARRMHSILSEVASSSVLTVGEFDGFARAGGVINFILDGGRIRFEINPTSAVSNHLHISSQLLSLGKIVDPDGAGSGI